MTTHCHTTLYWYLFIFYVYCIPLEYSGKMQKIFSVLLIIDKSIPLGFKKNLVWTPCSFHNSPPATKTMHCIADKYSKDILRFQIWFIAKRKLPLWHFLVFVIKTLSYILELSFWCLLPFSCRRRIYKALWLWINCFKSAFIAWVAHVQLLRCSA